MYSEHHGYEGPTNREQEQVYITVISHTNSTSRGVDEIDNPQNVQTVVKKIAWFSSLYVLSLTSFCAMGGSMRILLTYF